MMRSRDQLINEINAAVAAADAWRREQEAPAQAWILKARETMDVYLQAQMKAEGQSASAAQDETPDAIAAAAIAGAEAANLARQIPRQAHSKLALLVQQGREARTFHPRFSRECAEALTGLNAALQGRIYAECGNAGWMPEKTRAELNPYSAAPAMRKICGDLIDTAKRLGEALQQTLRPAPNHILDRVDELLAIPWRGADDIRRAIQILS